MQTSTDLSATDQIACPVPTAGPLGQLGQWTLLAREAEGTLSRIYRARPIGSPADRPAAYAVKILRERWEDDPRAVGLLAREAQIGRTVVHPHLISIFAAGLSESPYYVVMPWLEGQTLARMLENHEPIDVPVVLWIVRQTAEALRALYEAGWTHGDLKPSNLHVSPEGHVTVLDLGLARRSNEDDSMLERCVTGTCHYLAPETITSTLARDIRSDIYSLGVVFFEMLTGRLPFVGDSLAAIAAQHREASLPDLRRMMPHLPENVIQLARQMLAKEPLRRPQTPVELVTRLAELEIDLFAERAFC